MILTLISLLFTFSFLSAKMRKKGQSLIKNHSTISEKKEEDFLEK